MRKKSTAATTTVTDAPDEEARIEYVDLDVLARAKRNPKNHDLPTIRASILRHGFVAPLVENAKTGRLVAGHGRLEAVLAIKAETPDVPPKRVKVVGEKWFLPVVRGVSFPNEQRAEEYLLADNKLVELGGWNNVELAPMLSEIATRGAAAIAALGWQREDIEEILKAVNPGAEPPANDAGPQEPPKIPISRLGDLWILGDHRLLCGSSTNENDVGRLMNGERALLMATDPPYGVDYNEAKRGIPGPGFSSERFKDWGDIENDTLNPTELRTLLDQVFQNALSILGKGCGIYVWHPSGPLTEVFRAAMTEKKILIHRQIIWAKPGFVMTRSGMYHWAHEPCFYGWIQGNVPAWYGEKNQTSVWHVGKDAGVSVHPTQKPVEVFAIPMRNHTRASEVCYEPFSGSGTQIIAGESLGRRVFAMEIDPRYVDAAVNRWEKTTGKKATLEKVSRAKTPRKAAGAPVPVAGPEAA